MMVHVRKGDLDVDIQLTEEDCEFLRKEGFTHIAGFNLRTTGKGLWARVTRPQLNQLTMALEQAKSSARARETSKGPIELSPGESSEVIEIASKNQKPYLECSGCAYEFDTNKSRTCFLCIQNRVVQQSRTIPEKPLNTTEPKPKPLNTEPKKEEPTMPEVKPAKSILRQEADIIIERSAPQLLARRVKKMILPHVKKGLVREALTSAFGDAIIAAFLAAGLPYLSRILRRVPMLASVPWDSLAKECRHFAETSTTVEGADLAIDTFAPLIVGALQDAGLKWNHESPDHDDHPITSRHDEDTREG